MDIKSEGKTLLDNHKKLYKQLIEIPEKREMKYIEEMEEGVKIGKPRFKNPKYQWSTSLLVEVRGHLQNIWNFFDRYSYWFDDTLIPLLNTDERRMSKKSIIFLLEKDIWCTDEVYGKYLIEENHDGITISYSRRERKMKQITLKSKNDSEIKDWICDDAISQIKNQFKFLWGKLETEVEVCIKEEFHRKQKIMLKVGHFKDQIQKAINILNDWPEASLLTIGRSIELWLKTELKDRKLSKYDDIIRIAEIDGIITKPEMKLLSKIRKHYNYLKHNLQYTVDKTLITHLIVDFSKNIHLPN